MRNLIASDEGPEDEQVPGLTRRLTAICSKGMARIAIVVAVSFLLSLTVCQAQTSKDDFPSEQQINLVLTQAARAFDSYENTLQLEAQLVGGPESVAKDKETLTMARRVIADIKRNPSKGFNSPMGFLLVTNLDDASRNMALCSGQGGMQSTTELLDGKVSSATSQLHISQTCLDASTLLYTVSESALDLYAQYLSTQYKFAQQATQELQKCADLLKKSFPKK